MKTTMTNGHHSSWQLNILAQWLVVVFFPYLIIKRCPETLGGTQFSPLPCLELQSNHHQHTTYTPTLYLLFRPCLCVRPQSSLTGDKSGLLWDKEDLADKMFLRMTTRGHDLMLWTPTPSPTTPKIPWPSPYRPGFDCQDLAKHDIVCQLIVYYNFSLLFLKYVLLAPFAVLIMT